MDATRLPPRFGPTFFAALVDEEVAGWLDRHAPALAAAARIATVAAVVTKRSRHPACLVKSCPCGQEIGRSKDCVQRQSDPQFFVQFRASHRIHTAAANFLA